MSGFKPVQKWAKNVTGAIQFKDNTMNRTGAAHRVIPLWDLHRELRFRIWHPFWNGMLVSKCGEEVGYQQDPWATLLERLVG